MADKTINDLSNLNATPSGSSFLPIWEDDATKKVSVDDLVSAVGSTGISFSSAISGIGSETGQVADGDTLLEALAKVNDRLPLSGGTLTGALTAPSLAVSTGGSQPNTGFYRFSSSLLYGYNNNNFWLKVFNSNYVQFTGGEIQIGGSGVEVKLGKDETNVLYQRSGTSAQESRIYGTYTDASNYERLSLRTAAGDYTIAAEAAGTGTQRNLVLSGANRAAHISDVSSGTDAAYETAINAIIAALESHGIAATA